MAASLTGGFLAFCGGWLLFFLYRKYVGGRMNQAFRSAGPESHKKKGRIPTGSGIIIVLALLACAAWCGTAGGSRSLALVCIAAALMGLLGFIDDRAKVTGGSAGLKARFKLPAMLFAGALLLFHIRPDIGMGLSAAAGQSGTAGFIIGLPDWLFYALGLFLWLGAMNGSNFTDGLDGLLATTSIVSFLAMWMVLSGMALNTFSIVSFVIMGLLLAYLCFNWKPATLYVGDSGSLSVGALAAGLALLSGKWLFLGLFAAIWVLEVLSVMIQVVYFRLTKGRRLFLMTPIHHHFELAGWNEVTIVVVFALLQAWGCLSAWLWISHGLAAGIFCSAGLLAAFLALLLRYRKRVA